MKFSVAKEGIEQPEKIAADVDADTAAKIDGIFKEIVASFKAKFCCFDLSHMSCEASPLPYNHDGDIKTTESERIKYTGSWTKLDKIYVRPDMAQAIEFYKVADQTDNEAMIRQAIGHELAHEIWNYQMDAVCKKRWLKKAEDLKFDTPYLHHIDDDDPDEEMFCEYMSYRVTGIWIKI